MCQEKAERKPKLINEENDQTIKIKIKKKIIIQKREIILNREKAIIRRNFISKIGRKI